MWAEAKNTHKEKGRETESTVVLLIGEDGQNGNKSLVLTLKNPGTGNDKH